MNTRNPFENINFHVFTWETLIKDQHISCVRDLEYLKNGQSSKFEKRLKRLLFICKINDLSETPCQFKIDDELLNYKKGETVIEYKEYESFMSLKDCDDTVLSKNANGMVINTADEKAYKIKKNINDSLTNMINHSNTLYYNTCLMLKTLIKSMISESNSFKRWFSKGLVRIILKGSTAYNVILKKKISTLRGISNEDRKEFNDFVDANFTDGDNDTEFIITKKVSKEKYTRIYNKITSLLNIAMPKYIPYFYQDFTEDKSNALGYHENLIKVFDGRHLVEFNSISSKCYTVDIGHNNTSIIKYLNKTQKYPMFYSSTDVKIGEDTRFRLSRYKFAYTCPKLPDVKFSSEILDIVIAHPDHHKKSNSSKYEATNTTDISRYFNKHA